MVPYGGNYRGRGPDLVSDSIAYKSFARGERAIDNNHAERWILPAVLIRKNSYSNHSRRGEEAQAASMSVYRTLKQRGHHPIGIIIKAIESHLITAVLPPLPPTTTTKG